MPEEIKDLIEEQCKAFEEFKKTNDARLDAIEKNKASSELEEKTERINTELGKLSEIVDNLAKKANRLGAPGPEDEYKGLLKEHKDSWLKWVRKGDDSGLESFAAKVKENKAASINVGSPANGGYAIPIEQDREIMRPITDFLPMRQVCRVVSCSTEDYRKVVNVGGTEAGWVGETAERPATSAPTFTQVKPTFGEVYAYPEVTQKALDDVFFNVESELVQDISETFAVKEGEAFISGTGSTANQPVGLLTAPTAATGDGTRPFGTIQAISTGVADNFAATAPADSLIDLIYSCKNAYRLNGTFMLNSSILATVRKWKDKNDNYIWQPTMQAGEPSTIFGYKFVTNEYMPGVGANAIPIIFGDFKRAFWIFDRVGIRQLRDPYTHKPFVGFYTTKRVGTMLANTEAVKFLKCAA